MKEIASFIKFESILTAFEANYENDFFFRGEFHPSWELVYVMDGVVGVTGDDRVYRLEAGSIIFHKPMEFHKIWTMDNTNPHLFIMSFTASGSGLKSFENGIFKLTEKQREAIEDFINALKTTAEEKKVRVRDFMEEWSDNAYYSQLVSNKAEAFLLSVLLEGNEKIEQDKSENTQVFKEVITILTENIFENLTLDEIAKLCKKSKSQIKKDFKTVSDIGIHKYYLKLKISKATDLLLENMSVSEISEALKFSSPNYFSMVFKRETGYTPLEYRKRRYILQ